MNETRRHFGTVPFVSELPPAILQLSSIDIESAAFLSISQHGYRFVRRPRLLAFFEGFEKETEYDRIAPLAVPTAISA
jgi:hypothetical protein